MLLFENHTFQIYEYVNDNFTSVKLPCFNEAPNVYLFLGFDRLSPLPIEDWNVLLYKTESEEKFVRELTINCQKLLYSTTGSSIKWCCSSKIAVQFSKNIKVLDSQEISHINCPGCVVHGNKFTFIGARSHPPCILLFLDLISLAQKYAERFFFLMKSTDKDMIVIHERKDDLHYPRNSLDNCSVNISENLTEFIPKYDSRPIVHKIHDDKNDGDEQMNNVGVLFPQSLINI